jgi:hypothetical protein
MNAASLAIWISCGSVLVSAVGLVISVAAYRRSDTPRRLGRLSELSRDIADLRPRLDQLERTITEAVQSRARVSAALSHGLGGGMEVSIPKRPDYDGIETKSVTARQVSTRLEQLVQYMRDRAGRPR